ncbi:MAG: aspartate--tRNA(Asn) ligase [Candidatus Nanohaloarchaeota archaeon]|nr:aspartate--tRNA(Asn) ligase [Candidatus Nanohaloarchaeota archaeon]
MIRTNYIKDLKESEETIAGFLKEKRDLGKLIFLIVYDRSGEIQAVFKKNQLDEETFKKAKKVARESFIQIKGKVSKNEKAPGGKEILAETLTIINEAETPLPIEISGKVETNLDKRIKWRFLDLRRPEIQEIFVKESAFVKALEDFMHQQGFTRLFFSRITGEATEGGADYFPVLYFDKEAFLAQSPQLYKESVLLSGMDKVYDLGFVYRAEPHHTTRHLTEFMSFDVEMVTDNMQDLLELQREMLAYAFEKAQISVKIPKTIPVVSFEEAQQIAKEKGAELEKHDLTPEAERKLGEYALEKYDSDFIFVIDFPFEKKPFYLMRHENNPELTHSFDLLFRGLEITSGGLREHRYEERAKNMKEKGLDPEKFDHLRFFKYGMPPHGGFGMGIERVIEKALKLGNVREATLLPRDPENLEP